MRQSTKTGHVTTRRVHEAMRLYCRVLAVAVMGLFCSSCEAIVPTVSGSEAQRPFFENPEFDLKAFALAHPTLTIFMTGRDGAVTASFEGENTTVLHAHLTRNDQRLLPL